MADAKITQLPAGAAVQASDLTALVQNVSATPVTNKSSISQIATAIAILIGGGGSPSVPVDWKDSVVVATTGNIALTGEQTIDGVLTSASRVLVWNQTTASQNGIYVSAAGAWIRSDDADTSAEVTSGMAMLVDSGTLYADQVFSLVTNGTIVLDTTALTFQPIIIPYQAFIIKIVAGTAYTNVLLDSNRRLVFTNAAAKTMTVAPQVTVNAAVGTEIEILNAGAGLLTIAPGAGVTVNALNGVLTVPQWHCVKLKKRANANTWNVTGIGMSANVASILGAATTAAVSTILQETGLSAESTGFRGIPQVIFSADLAVIASHGGKELYHPSSDANARVVTIPANASLALPIGFVFSVGNDSANAVTVAITTDTLVQQASGLTGSVTLAQYEGLLVWKVTATRWYCRVIKTTETWAFTCSDYKTTAIAAATDIGGLFAPYAATVLAVSASLHTAQTGGNDLTVDINEAGTTILSTKLIFDDGENTTLTATTQPVISDSAIAAGAKISADVDQIGDGTAKGLIVYLRVRAS